MLSYTLEGRAIEKQKFYLIFFRNFYSIVIVAHLTQYHKQNFWSTRPTLSHCRLVITTFTRVDRPSVRPTFLWNITEYHKTKQSSNESCVRYWRTNESGWGDHWWQMSCLRHFLQSKFISNEKILKDPLLPRIQCLKYVIRNNCSIQNTILFLPRPSEKRNYAALTSIWSIRLATKCMRRGIYI